MPHSGLWTANFVKEHPWIVEIDPDFLLKRTNTADLRNRIPHFQEALNVIQGTADLSDSELEESCVGLYTQLHARYLLSGNGLYALDAKYRSGFYGTCPRIECHGRYLIPYGESIEPHESKACLYCPGCRDLFVSDANVDGAFFGPYFAPLYGQIVIAQDGA